MINAAEATVGQVYDTIPGIIVEVVEKLNDHIVVKSFTTGNNVKIALDYKLTTVGEDVQVTTSSHNDVTEEVQMANDTDTSTVEAPKKLKKSTLVDEGLRANLSVEDIVKNVLAAFPEALEKGIRNLVSVRRSKLKKQTPTT